MTRYKELRRLERAIDEQNLAELVWALAWCRMRLRIAKLKAHRKTWMKRIKLCEKALSKLCDSAN